MRINKLYFLVILIAKFSGSLAYASSSQDSLPRALSSDSYDSDESSTCCSKSSIEHGSSVNLDPIESQESTDLSYLSSSLEVNLIPAINIFGYSKRKAEIVVAMLKKEREMNLKLREKVRALQLDKSKLEANLKLRTGYKYSETKNILVAGDQGILFHLGKVVEIEIEEVLNSDLTKIKYLGTVPCSLPKVQRAENIFKAIEASKHYQIGDRVVYDSTIAYISKIYTNNKAKIREEDSSEEVQYVDLGSLVFINQKNT